jgi:XTP/dITP diphosphohydrolase
MTSLINIVYSTTSLYKQAEIDETCRSILIDLPNGNRVVIGDVFKFEFRDGKPSEPLERDLEQMVRHKVVSAYKNLLVPCIVEHAGLIFDDYINESYPGGLTQPMWDALGAERFIKETNGQSRRVVARAVIGYCDGLNVRCFRGDTPGMLTDSPSGSREFYWDTIFIPETETLTYAAICDDPKLGLGKKVALSQSTKALVRFLQHRLRTGESPLFPYAT